MPKKKCEHTWHRVAELPVPELQAKNRKYFLETCDECGAEQIVRLEEKKIRVTTTRPGPDIYLKSAYMDLAYVLSQYDDDDVSDSYDGENPKRLLETAVDFCDLYIQLNGGKRVKME